MKTTNSSKTMANTQTDAAKARKESEAHVARVKAVAKLNEEKVTVGVIGLHDESCRKNLSENLVEYLAKYILAYKAENPNSERFSSKEYDLTGTNKSKRVTKRSIKSSTTTTTEIVFGDDNPQEDDQQSEEEEEKHEAEPEKKEGEQKDADKKESIKTKVANCNAAGKATLCFIVSQFVYELGKGKTATKITSADEFENYANTLPEESNFSRNVVSAVKQFGKAVKNIPDGELPNFLRARTTPLFTGNREKFGDFIATYLTTYYKLMAQSLSTMFWNDVVGKTVNFSLISTAIELSFNLIRSPGMSLINFFENLNRYLDIVEPPPTEEEKAKAKEAREAKKAKSDAKTEPKVETAKETPKTEPKVEPKPTVEVSSTKRVTLKPAKK